MTSPAAAKTYKDGTRFYSISGEDLPSSNTALKVLGAPGLERWKSRTIAKEIAKDENLAAQALDRVDDAIQTCFDRNRGASEKGTDVHSASEDLDNGLSREEIKAKYSADTLEYLNQYITFKKDFGVEILHVERTVYNKAVGYAGTFDRIVGLRDYKGSFVLDLKTGKGVYDDHVLQQSSYAYAEAMFDPETGESSPMPTDLRKDIALLLHLSQEHYDLIPVELPKAWETFKATVRCWHWKRTEGREAMMAKINPDGSSGDVI